MDGGVDTHPPNNVTGDEHAPETSALATYRDTTSTHLQQQQQQQQQDHATQHQIPSLATYTTGQTAPGANSAFSPQTPTSAVSNLANPHSATYPAPIGHDDSYGDPDGATSYGTPPLLGPGGTPLDKKARACESCRGLKVRCEPDPSNPDPDDGPCKRCAKAGRTCVVTQPTRKRQKKTDSRVAELEKKIDALTASLQATRGSGAHELRETHAAVVIEPYTMARAWQGAATAAPSAPGLGSARTPAVAHSPATAQGPARFGGMDIDFRKTPTPGPVSVSPVSQPPVVAGLKRKVTDMASSIGEDRTSTAPPSAPTPLSGQASGSGVGHGFTDMIDRGILTMDRANELFIRYTEMMVPHLPGVVFPAGTTAAQIRRAKPVLFLAIMAVSSSELPSTQRTLTKDLMQILAEKIIVVGEKSLELVQALQVAVMWYWPPEHFEELKFYQLVHIAAVMAIDIGLGRKKSIQGAGLGLRRHIPMDWRQQHFKKNPQLDATSLEARRAWLACYFMATNTSMALHRPHLIRWTSFMTECMDVLQSSPEAAPTDRYFCHLVWTHKLAEEVGIQFAMDDPSATINIADARTQYALKGFERNLEKYSSSIAEEFRQPSLLMSFHVISLYMHEIATQPGDTPEWRQVNPAENVRDVLASEAFLTPAHINAVSACLTAIDGTFKVFLSMEVERIRCLPVFNFVRVAYAVVLLIKMYFAASSSDSELGKVINKDNMKVEQHLDNLLEKFSLAAADERCRPASKFLVVLVMLRTWFQKQKNSPGNTASEKPTPVPHADYGKSNTASPSNMQGARPGREQAQRQQSDYSTAANTPLQLLSEIASKDSSGAAGPRAAPTPGTTPNFFWGGRQAQQPFMYDDDQRPTDNNSTNATSATPTNTSGITPGATNAADASAANSGFQFNAASNSGNPAAGIPWWDSSVGFDYTGIGSGDGFAQAMDLTLAGIPDGSMMNMLPLPPPGTWDLPPGQRYVLQDPAFLNALDGMGMSGGGTGSSQTGNGGAGGEGYEF